VGNGHTGASPTRTRVVVGGMGCAGGSLPSWPGAAGPVDKAPGWPSPGAPPKTASFARRSGLASPSSGLSHRPDGDTPRPPATASSPLSHRQQLGPVWPVNARRVHAVFELEMQGPCGGHCHWPGSGRAGLAWLLIVGISCSAGSSFQSSGSLRLPITKQGGGLDPRPWRSSTPPGGGQPHRGLFAPPPAQEGRLGPPAGHRGRSHRLDNRHQLASLGQQASLRRASIAGDGGPVYLHPGPWRGLEAVHSLGSRGLAQRPSKVGKLPNSTVAAEP